MVAVVQREPKAPRSLWPRAILLVLSSACGPAVSSGELLQIDPGIAFVVRYSGEQVIGVERLRRTQEGAATLLLREGTELAVVLLDAEGLAAAHPAADLSKLEAAELQLREPGDTCTERISEDAGSAVVPLPEELSVLRWAPEEPSGFASDRLPSSVLGRLVLSLQLGACAPPQRARPFAKDGYALDNPFYLRDRWHSADSAAEDDIDVFSPADVAYINRDTALVVFFHGLAFIRRGERLSSVSAPEYFSADRLPAFGSSRPWNLSSASFRAPAGSQPARVLVSGWRPSAVSATFESITALLSLEDEVLEVLSATVTLGKAGRSGLDVRGRFFAPMSEHGSGGDPPHRATAVFADPDEAERPYAVARHTHEIKALRTSPFAEMPHVLITLRPSRLQVGDLVDGRIEVDEIIPYHPDGAGLLARSVSVLESEGGLLAVVGGERAELALRRPDGAWTAVSQHLDLNVRRVIACHARIDACGRAQPSPELAELWAASGLDAQPRVFMAPEVCPHVLVSRLDGCTALVEVDRPFVVSDSRIITLIRPSLDGRTALVGGRGGMLAEIDR
jgi:hypothetical protein